MKNLWHSSYEKNNYGDFFYSLMRIYKPKKVVELGTKAGYSAYHIARGLKDNERSSSSNERSSSSNERSSSSNERSSSSKNKGSLDCFDLWEKYEFKSVPKSVAEENLKEFKDIVSFTLRDAVGVEKKYKTVDILHIDLSNEGEILDKIIPQWIDKVRQFIIIEGGSSERDKFEWMRKFKKMPIKKWLASFALQSNIEYFTLEPFPSVTIIRKLT